MIARSVALFLCLLVLFTHCTRQPTSSPRDMSGKPKVGLSPNATLRIPVGDRPRRIEILFLGDNGHHKPLERVPQLMAALGSRGINITYTDQLIDLNTSTLVKYDGLLIYANWDSIPKPQERALLDFVASGKGLIPVHCASYCFRNSPEYVDKVVGGQFFRHKMDTIRTRFTNPADAIVAGPRMAGPRMAGPRMAGPRMAGPRMAGPRMAGPQMAGLRPAHVYGPGAARRLPVCLHISRPLADYERRDESTIRNSLPCPIALTTEMAHSCASTIFCT